MLTGTDGLGPLAKQGAMPLQLAREVRADQYGIRTQVLMDGQAIKLEVVLEARIELQVPTPKDQICCVATLTALDLAASKLMANADRQADDGVFSRDLIDLAMMDLPLTQLLAAKGKAVQAYGSVIDRDLGKAIDRMAQRAGWLDRCMQAMSMELPKAVVFQKIRKLMRLLPTL